MADVNGPVCLNHPDTPATARCAACGKCICDECIVSRNGFSYCSERCAENAAASQSRVDCALEGKKRADAKGKVRALIVLAVIVLVVVGIYIIYQKNQEANSGFFKQVGSDLDSTWSNTKKAVKKSLPTDSSYKKTREGLVK